MANGKRLIDANALKAEFTGNFNEMWHYTGIRAMIDVAPTVDAEEVVHGRWVQRIVDWSAPYSWKVECSNCGFDICGLGDAYLFKYCPNCGAKMDGERKDNEHT